jgi:hypothetical protein
MAGYTAHILQPFPYSFALPHVKTNLELYLARVTTKVSDITCGSKPLCMGFTVQPA